VQAVAASSDELALPVVRHCYTSLSICTNSPSPKSDNVIYIYIHTYIQVHIHICICTPVLWLCFFVYMHIPSVQAVAAGSDKLSLSVVRHGERAARVVLVSLRAVDTGGDHVEDVLGRLALFLIPEAPGVRVVGAREEHGVVLLLHLHQPAELVEVGARVVRNAIVVVKYRLTIEQKRASALYTYVE